MRYLLLLLLIGCGKAPDQGFTTPRLLGLISNFEEDFDTEINFQVKFVRNFTIKTPNVHQVGVCQVNGLLKYVEILDGFTAAPELPVIVYHELGHCALELQHYDISPDIMNSTMNSQVINNFTYYKDLMISNYFNYIYP